MTILQMLTAASLFFTTANTIYDFDIAVSDGSTVHISDFRGKKILFVNTATNSVYVNQYASLEQLYQQNKDSLIIIALPSNSFADETGSNSEIQDFVSSHYHITYLLATKTNVAGTDISPLYNWLTRASENGAMDNPVDGDFTKYLINEEGVLTGTFASNVNPLSDLIQNALRQ